MLPIDTDRLDAVDGTPLIHLPVQPHRTMPWHAALGREADGRPGSIASLAVKSMLDRGGAALAMLLLLPLLLLIAGAIRLDSAGPAVFSQRRQGQHGRAFTIYKFRTMRWRDGPSDGRIQTRAGDCRVTRVGRMLRRTSLDELPQLWNILNGTMSLVGPRPHPVAMRTEGLLCEDISPGYGERHRAKPGITGLAQINGHRGATATVDQLRARLDDDLRYVDAWSLLLDLKILLLTPVRLVTHRGRAF